MKCVTCVAEIDPKWVHAVEQNICPFCGKEIMAEHLKNLLSSLRQTMDQLLEYPDQLNDWLLSNYNYMKYDANKKYAVENIINNAVASNIENEDGVIVEKIKSDEETSAFFRRAQDVKSNSTNFKNPAERTQHLKALAQQIKKEGSTAVSQTGELYKLSPEMMDNADPEAVAEYESLMSGNEIASSLPESNMDDDIPLSVLNMASQAKNGSKNSNMDLIRLRQLQEKTREARENFQSGSKGSFRR